MGGTATRRQHRRPAGGQRRRTPPTHRPRQLNRTRTPKNQDCITAHLWHLVMPAHVAAPGSPWPSNWTPAVCTHPRPERDHLAFDEGAAGAQPPPPPLPFRRVGHCPGRSLTPSGSDPEWGCLSLGLSQAIACSACHTGSRINRWHEYGEKRCWVARRVRPARLDRHPAVSRPPSATLKVNFGKGARCCGEPGIDGGVHRLRNGIQ